MTANDYTHLSAAEILETLCPAGNPVEGVVLDQDWDSETTRILFEDESFIRVDGPDVAFF